MPHRNCTKLLFCASREGSNEGIVCSSHDVVARLRLCEAVSAPAKETAKKEILWLLDVVLFLSSSEPIAYGSKFCHLFPHITENIEVKRESSNKSINIISPCQDIIDIGVGDKDCACYLLAGVAPDSLM